jgi:hypothetical protein
MDFPEGIGKSSPSDLGLSYGIFIHPDSFIISKHYITFKGYSQTKIKEIKMKKFMLGTRIAFFFQKNRVAELGNYPR